MSRNETMLFQRGICRNMSHTMIVKTKIVALTFLILTAKPTASQKSAADEAAVVGSRKATSMETVLQTSPSAFQAKTLNSRESLREPP